MYEQLSLPICQNVKFTVSDFHAKVSALQDCAEDFQIHAALFSLKSCDWLKKESLKYYSQKMLQDCLPMRGGRTFQTIIQTMGELGYFVEWQVLNSKYFVPQNRERVFIIGHLGNGCRRKIFPIIPNGEKADGIQGHKDHPIIANCLQAGDRKTRGTFPIENGGGGNGERIPQIIQVGQLYESGWNTQAGRIYDPNGLSPTLNTCQGGNRMPKVLIYEKSIDDRRKKNI